MDYFLASERLLRVKTTQQTSHWFSQPFFGRFAHENNRIYICTMFGITPEYPTDPTVLGLGLRLGLGLLAHLKEINYNIKPTLTGLCIHTFKYV